MKDILILGSICIILLFWNISLVKKNKVLKMQNKHNVDTFLNILKEMGINFSIENFKE